MKYLPINQTHLKAVEKYAFMSYEHNICKYRFNKIHQVGSHYTERVFTMIFYRYMNDDIYIDWGK